MAKLYFRFGAMNSGKSTALLQVAHNYEQQGMKVIVVKSCVDKKGEDQVVSRLGVTRTVDHLFGEEENIYQYAKKWKREKIRCILVEEAQFLKEQQVFDLWRITKLYNIPVICYGLRTTFQGKFFVGSKPLMELADEIDELITVCYCGKKARFNARKVNGVFVIEGDEVAIDGFDNVTYEPLCGYCYARKVLKLKR